MSDRPGDLLRVEREYTLDGQKYREAVYGGEYTGQTLLVERLEDGEWELAPGQDPRGAP